MRIGLLSESGEAYSKKLLLQDALEHRYPAFSFLDLGVNSKDDRVDSEALGDKAAEAIERGTVDYCLLVSSSGNGLQIYANKHDSVRAMPFSGAELIVEEFPRLKPNMFDLAAFLPIADLIDAAAAFLDASRQVREAPTSST